MAVEVHKIEIKPSSELVDEAVEFIGEYVPKAKRVEAVNVMVKLFEANAMEACDKVVEQFANQKSGSMPRDTVYFSMKLFGLVGFVSGLATGLVFARILDLLA